MTTNRRFRQHYGAFRSDHFVNNPGENSPKSPLLPNSPFSPNSPTFRGPYSWVNLFALIISPTTLAIGEISPKSPLSPNSPFSPTLRDPSNWVNWFALFISSTTLANLRLNRHFRQICRFRPIRQHFGGLIAGLIYSLLPSRQQTWRNFARIAIFASPCISGDISFYLFQMVYIRKERESFLHCSPFEHWLCSRPAFITSKELSPSNHWNNLRQTPTYGLKQNYFSFSQDSL